MIAVTGANGHLGRRLLARLAPRGPVRALVRSADAARRVQALGIAGLDVRVVDYASSASLAQGLEDCRAVVHLVGIIRESARSRYRDAHEGACAALVEAAAHTGTTRAVYLSILGAKPEADNACLASKGSAERILLRSALPTTVIRVPMVLGEGDYAAGALARRAVRRCNVLVRAASLEQPIYAGDVVEAVVAVLDAADLSGGFDLAGPTSLTRAALTHRAAALTGGRTRVLSLPLAPLAAVAWLAERLLDEPPMTPAMLGVLDHDDCIDPSPAAVSLGISLTPLDETLRRCLPGRSR